MTGSLTGRLTKIAKVKMHIEIAIMSWLVCLCFWAYLMTKIK